MDGEVTRQHGSHRPTRVAACSGHDERTPTGHGYAGTDAHSRQSPVGLDSDEGERGARDRTAVSAPPVTVVRGEGQNGHVAALGRHHERDDPVRRSRRASKLTRERRRGETYVRGSGTRLGPRIRQGRLDPAQEEGCGHSSPPRVTVVLEESAAFSVPPRLRMDTCPRWVTSRVTVTGDRRRYDLAKLRALAPRKGGPSVRVTLAYARVSNHDQEQDLGHKVTLLESFSTTNRRAYEVLQTVDSGLDDHKKGLRVLMKRIGSSEVGRLVITYKDRRLRFGSESVFSGVRAVWDRGRPTGRVDFRDEGSPGCRITRGRFLRLRWGERPARSSPRYGQGQADQGRGPSRRGE